jgi:hypothetical protein
VDQQFEIISKQLSIAEERNEECEEEEEEKEEATIKDTNPLIQINEKIRLNFSQY